MYMESRKNGSDEPTCREEQRCRCREGTKWTQQGEGEGEMNWEGRINIHTHHCV